MKLIISDKVCIKNDTTLVKTLLALATIFKVARASNVFIYVFSSSIAVSVSVVDILERQVRTGNFLNLL